MNIPNQDRYINPDEAFEYLIIKPAHYAVPAHKVGRM